MLELYTWDSPNGEKVHIALEELGIECEVHPVDLGRGAQRSPSFLALNPAGQIPVLVDTDGDDPLVVRDSTAILTYLADREGRLLAGAGPRRYDALSWMMYLSSTVAPALGLFHQLFSGDDTAVPAVLRLLRERIDRAFRAIDTRLREGEYLAGAYSMADIACYPWLREPERCGVDREELPGLAAWLERMAARPAVARGIAEIEALSAG